MLVIVSYPQGRDMIRKLLLPAACALLLGGCVTGYGYSDRGYYYGRPSVNVYGGVGYGSGYGYYPYGRYGYSRYGYGYPSYGSYYGGGYGYPYYYGRYGYPYYPYYPRGHYHGDGHDHGDRDHDHDDDRGDGKGRKPPWRDWARVPDDRQPTPGTFRTPRPTVASPVPGGNVNRGIQATPRPVQRVEQPSRSSARSSAPTRRAPERDRRRDAEP